MIVVIQALVILFTGAMEDLLRPGLETLFMLGPRQQRPRPWRAKPSGRRAEMDYDDHHLDARRDLRLTTPLLLACLAGLYSERSGIFDIGLEGKMLAGAFGAAAVAGAHRHRLARALRRRSSSRSCMALLHGFASITLKGNQIISGVAINFLAAGLTAVLGLAWFHQGGHTPPLPAGGRFPPITWPVRRRSSRDVPIIGPIYSRAALGPQHPRLYRLPRRAGHLVGALSNPLRPAPARRRRKPQGGRHRRHLGAWLRYRALIITGVLCGIAGAYFSIAQGDGFINNMTAGKGYIALAALIFAKWRPVPAMFACLLFGFLDALQIRLQGVPLPLIGQVPVQFIQALPYVLTVVLLAGFIGKAIAPKAGGVPYTKER